MAGLNDRTSAERVHIGFFGMRNAGKSSLVNAVTGQKLSLVSDVMGTTTDPVQKAMEILPLGAVVIIDTPGIDDEGELGEMRVKRTKDALRKTDIAVLVVDAERGLQTADKELLESFSARGIAHITAYNKADMLDELPSAADGEIYVSAATGLGVNELRERLGSIAASSETERVLVGDLLSPGDTVVLVTPIDAAAPKGRLILPQQQTIRDILDAGCVSIVTKDTELERSLSLLSEPPKLVITDSQAFGKVSRIVPTDVMLTSFSILFARYKGELARAVQGAAALDSLHDGDTVLISEGCTHHRQCGDIGTVKLPRWIDEYTGKNLNYSFTSGTEFPDELDRYSLIVHCGGCMLSEREMRSRVALATAAGVPITNYGIAIAQIHGILKRSLSPFPTIAELISNK